MFVAVNKCLVKNIKWSDSIIKEGILQLICILYILFVQLIVVGKLGNQCFYLNVGAWCKIYFGCVYIAKMNIQNITYKVK